MTEPDRPLNRNITPKEWSARWAISPTTPLTSLRMRNEIDKEMRLFAQRLPEYHSALMSGVLHDLLITLDPHDPWLNLYKDDAGVVRLLGGEAFGTWESGTDIGIVTHSDIARDLTLSPLVEPLTDSSVELIFHASHSWEEARAFLMGGCPVEPNRQHPFEVAEDAIRWALARRQAYAMDGDGFFPTTAAAWANRSTKIAHGEPFDEARMLRLRSGASIEPGTYERIR